MKTFFAILLFAVGLFAGLKHATAAQSPDLVCRAQAKEVAKQTYTDCITSAKAAQTEQLRKAYQSKLKALKSQYEADLKKVGGKKATAKAATLKTPQVSEETDDAAIETEAMPLPSSDDNTTI